MRALMVALLVLVAVLFVYVSGDLPDRGDPAAPASVHLSPRFSELTESDIGIPNVVAAILADFRSFDTLGELVVIFTAGIAVFLILGRGRGE